MIQRTRIFLSVLLSIVLFASIGMMLVVGYFAFSLWRGESVATD